MEREQLIRKRERKDSTKQNEQKDENVNKRAELSIEQQVYRAREPDDVY